MIIVYLDIGVACKKVPDSTTAFSFDVARKFWRRTIQEWRCQRSMVVRAVELWLTMHTLDWPRGGPNTLNSTKLYKTPLLHGLSMNSKNVGNEFCHGSGKLRRNVGKLRRNVGKLRRNAWELRRQLLLMFIKQKTSPGSKTSHQFKCASLPLSPNVVHTYQWK